MPNTVTYEKHPPTPPLNTVDSKPSLTSYFFFVSPMGWGPLGGHQIFKLKNMIFEGFLWVLNHILSANFVKIWVLDRALSAKFVKVWVLDHALSAKIV